MNDHPAHPRDIVLVHPGVKVGKHDLSGVHLTVVDDQADQLELTQYTGGEHYYLLPSDVDVITRQGVA